MWLSCAIEALRAMIGACGPYNLGGSATIKPMLGFSRRCNIRIGRDAMGAKNMIDSFKVLE
jgi:hypothetical protein